MLKFTIFASHDGQFRPGRMIYVTLFAGCELLRSTVAKDAISARGVGRDGNQPPLGPCMITIFGGTSIKYPTLAEEYVDLRDMLKSGTLTLDEWDRAAASAGVANASAASFTLFAGFNENETPSEDEEVNALAIQRHIGNVPDQAGNILQLGVGLPLAERIATVRRAAVAR